MIDFEAFAAAYEGGARVADVVGQSYAGIADGDPVWISRVPAVRVLARARALDVLTPEARANLPLFGIPFGVKDNIDVAGVATTAACAAFAYMPQRSATVVERLEAAGAIAIGKTNLDQFATGLVGTRSPYGVPRNPFNDRYIPGGSSSGSAVAVARGLVPFALGTDTAGSGRVPAGFTATVGLKPTPGLVSTAGVVPACRSLDCVSFFTRNVDDAVALFDVAVAPDPRDPFSRPRPLASARIPGTFRFAVPQPDQRIFFGDHEAQKNYERSLARLESLGGEMVNVDLTPCFAAAELLYEGAFVAERTAAIGDFADAHSEAMLEVTRKIVGAGRMFTAVDAFRAHYRVRELRVLAAEIFEQADVLVVPTTPTAYRLDEIAAEPITFNTNLGTYTNFVNLLDLCAIAIPSARYANNIPIGITLIGPAFDDARIAGLAARILAKATLAI